MALKCLSGEEIEMWLRQYHRLNAPKPGTANRWIFANSSVDQWQLPLAAIMFYGQALGADSPTWFPILPY